MASVTINLPEEVLGQPHRTAEEFVKELRLAAAIHWYSRGEISMGKAAQIAGIPLADFLDMLARKKIDVFHVDIEDLKKDLARG